MRFLEEIDKDIWKLKADSNVYLLNLNEPIVIDTGRRQNNELLTKFLDKVRPLSEIKTVIFTHLHYDHIGNFDLFPNASFYASEAEIASFEKSPKAAILDEDMAKKFKIRLEPIQDFNDLVFILTPGHTLGSICLYLKSRKILFSGDSLFENKKFGRTDLPTSSPKKMKISLMKLINFDFKILCPGHDY